jgi:signal transduction histidine kinase
MTTGTAATSDLSWIRALYELGQRAVDGTAPSRVLQEIVEHIVRGFDAESGSIAMVVDGIDQLEIVAGTDLPPGAIGRRLVRGVGVFGHVVATGQPVLINGNAAQSGLPVRVTETRERATRSAMCWPLLVRERIIGALAVNRGAERPKYTPYDLDCGQAVTSLLALVIANHRMHVEREQRIIELSTLNATMQRMNAQLEDAQNQVIQADKLASIGQISAGVAHEINNPVGFVLSNLGTLESYLQSIFALFDAYARLDTTSAKSLAEHAATVRSLDEKIDFGFLRGDIAALLAESRDGLLRVKSIVQDLKDFSRGGFTESWETVDLHAALNSTLNIVRNELKYKVTIDTVYGDVPEVECMPSRLNQVFVNLLVNAGQAIETSGTITISTGTEGSDAWIRIEDTGCGIAPEHLHRVFEPFFTTKPVGRGTGLGLSVSYAIVRKHGGRIEVKSEVGCGTRFTVRIPIRQPHVHDDASIAAKPSDPARFALRAD